MINTLPKIGVLKARLKKYIEKHKDSPFISFVDFCNEQGFLQDKALPLLKDTDEFKYLDQIIFANLVKNVPQYKRSEFLLEHYYHINELGKDSADKITFEIIKNGNTDKK